MSEAGARDAAGGVVEPRADRGTLGVAYAGPHDGPYGATRREVEARVSPATVDAVLRALLRSGPLSRAALVEQTALSRPSVSAAVADLLAAGRLEEVAVAPRGRGRPGREVRISTRRADALGIEIGRRHVAVAVAVASGSVVAAETTDVDPSTTLRERAAAALGLLDVLTLARGIDVGAVRRVAVGTPGPRVDAPPGSGPPEPGRERAEVAGLLADRFGVPVDLGNNTRWTAVAVARRRPEPVSALVYLRVDEGVGGGVVQGGEAVTGAAGAAGEMGHVSVDVTGARCRCGGRGCLELVAGLPAVLAAAGLDDPDALRDRAHQPAPAAAIERAATATGTVLAGVLALTNPSVVVVGGSVAALPGFLPRLEAVARDAAPGWATLDLVVEPVRSDHLLGAVGAATAASAAAASTAVPAGGAPPRVPAEPKEPVR